MELSLVRFVSYVRKPCFIRFQPPFLPFSAWLKCKSAGHRSILTDSGSTSGKSKCKQNDDNGNRFVRWAEKEHGGEMSSSPCFFGLGYPVSNQN